MIRRLGAFCREKGVHLHWAALQGTALWDGVEEAGPVPAALMRGTSVT